MSEHVSETAVIQSLWVGSELSSMEELSIASFLRHGHGYVLYVYGDVANIPAGTSVKDANAILPESAIFQYREHASYAGFANSFRYKLLLEEGGWWADTDMICLRPWDFTAPYVFSSQPSHAHASKLVDEVNNNGMKVPRSSPIMARAWQACQAKDPSRLEWGETGPQLLQEAVQTFRLQRFVQPHAAFCPYGWQDWESALDPDIAWEFDEETYAVHLWNEMWRRAGYDKNHSYNVGCLYEQLKSRYLRR